MTIYLNDKKCFFGLTLAVIFGIFLHAQEIQFQGKDVKTNILQVADHYAREGNFKDAILQYYEFLYRFPDDTLVPVIKIKLAAVYQENGSYDLAEKHLLESIKKYDYTKYDLEMRIRLAFLYYEKRDYQTAIEYAVTQKEAPFRLVELYGWIQLGEISEADSLVYRFNTDDYSPEIIPEYRKLRQSKSCLSWKRKYGTYALSALLPGAGRILVGEHKEGVLTAVGFYGLVKVAIYALSNQPTFYYYAATGTLIYYGLNMYSTHFAIQRYSDRIMKRNLVRLTAAYPLVEQLHLTLPY